MNPLTSTMTRKASLISKKYNFTLKSLIALLIPPSHIIYCAIVDASH